MAFSRGIHHLLLGTLICLLVIGFSATYWAIAGQDSLLLRDDNPRRIAALAAIQRGSIFDRHGRPLAETVDQANKLRRRYPMPSTFSAVGYFSLRFGASGAEAAYDHLLAGSREVTTLREFFDRRLLHLPQTGSDIRLSIDADLQDALVTALGGSRGAAVVVNALTGEILSLVSQPAVDANELDENWEELVSAEGQPFFNRAIQGNYQLGGASYTLLMAHAITSGFDLRQRFPQAAAPIEFEDGMTIACLFEPGSSELTLTEAYAFGCPAPFRAYFRSEAGIDMEAILKRFAFDEPIALDGFPQPAPINLPAAPSAVQMNDAALQIRAALGQGDMTTTPLHMAAIMAAVSTDGKLRKLYLLAATRPPGAQQWRETSIDPTIIPVVSVEAAQELRAVMRRSWSALPIDAAGADVGAHVAMSQSGEGVQLWLNGFFGHSDGTTYAFVLLLEDDENLPRLLSIGRTLVQALDIN